MDDRYQKTGDDQVGVLCTTSAWFCKYIVLFKLTSHLRVRARDRLTVWMVSEMLAMKVLFEVTARREIFQAISCR